MAKRTTKNSGTPPPDAPNGRSASGTDVSIHREIWAAIIDHRIPPGTALPEDALSTAFGVSRTIVRKVLQRLGHERLVDIVPNKGATVAKPSNDEAKQVFDARRAIERAVVERVVASAREQDIEVLVGLVAEERLAFDSGDKRRRLTLSGDFHDAP